MTVARRKPRLLDDKQERRRDGVAGYSVSRYDAIEVEECDESKDEIDHGLGPDHVEVGIVKAVSALVDGSGLRYGLCKGEDEDAEEQPIVN